MFFDSDAAVAVTQEQVLAAFARDQAAVVQASTVNDERSKQFRDFTRGAPVPNCERHGEKDINGHFCKNSAAS